MATLHELAALLPGARLVGGGDVAITRVHSDTRSLQPGDLFVALAGERFDAHDFIADARTKGCAAVLGERGIAEAGLPGLLVADSRRALGALAAAWRRRFSIPLIAVTGSNGKTTVTQMIASILSAWVGEGARLATQGNFNNDIGLPLTLLRLRPQHRAAVVEIGMNHRGEVAELAPMAAPTVALVNNAQREHQEFMSSVEAVARENGEVLRALMPGGTAVFPAGDAYSALWQSLAQPHRCATFGFGIHAYVNADVLNKNNGQLIDTQGEYGHIQLDIALPGQHNAHNALAAATCALVAGAPAAAVAQGLAAFRPVKGRSHSEQLRVGAHTLTLIDDTYNANPDSVRAAIDVLAACAAPRWLVLGDMGEVGAQGPQFHREVGAYARERGVSWLFALGDQAMHAAQAFDATPHADGRPHAAHFATRDALAHELRRALGIELPASVLIKGSRFMRMEEFVQVVRDTATTLRGHDAA
ncbi:MAG: UDP-N-acetylmuramoyl-tripeptide--D-alanyl-D-alanine ligase [Betaproteobacteria bacterium]|nr:UDP-N-acetylmuramoyl-tripeptide--D-alanyl-D-alanine ligase [Betaproteobacteria bacterium]